MNLQSIEDLYMSERDNPKLSVVKPDLYEQLVLHITGLEQSRVQVGSSRERDMLDNEIRNTKRMIENIYDIRTKKILSQAAVATIGSDIDTSRMTPKEKLLYDTLVAAMSRVRGELLAPIIR
jgi:DNA replication factor GINS